MFEDDNKIGICLINGDILLCYIISISGSFIDTKLVKKFDVNLINKHNKGGQSSVRFGRIADGIRHKYVDLISENIISSYMYDNNTKCMISKLIIAGNGVMKNDVIKTDIFSQYMSKYLYKVINTNNFNENTAENIVTSLLDEINIQDNSQIENKINELIVMNPDILAFGKDECLKFIDENNFTELYVNKDILSDDDKILLTNKNVKLIITQSSHFIKTYGNWILIKKY